MKIFQIYYDEASRNELDPGFIPLDNIRNERPDWYEFWVIRNYFNTQVLDPNAWYGFLSPKFKLKTELDSKFVLTALSNLSSNFEVALFTHSPDVLAIHQNMFEQGEYAHPGLLRASQGFLDATYYKVELQSLVTNLETSVYSNYIVAKAKFWNEWLRLANLFFEYAEIRHDAKNAEIDRNLIMQNASHMDKQIAMKVFVQERLASIVLSQNKYVTFVPEHIRQFMVYTMPGRQFLLTFDELKSTCIKTGDRRFLQKFLELRTEILPPDRNKILKRMMGHSVDPT